MSQFGQPLFWLNHRLHKTYFCDQIQTIIEIVRIIIILNIKKQVDNNCCFLKSNNQRYA